MNTTAFGRISLTEEEEDLLGQIDFDGVKTGYDPDSGLAARELTTLLLERKAIPEVRLSYFFEADYNIGSKNSRYETFVRNGVSDEDVFEHAHFFRYLRYFVFGPDLPQSTKKGFSQIIEDDPLISAVELDKLRRFAREETRRLRMDRRVAAEEFYKLALESDLDGDFAGSIRTAVMQVR